VRSLCLDPEFKASYANLSATYLALGQYEDAKRVAEHGLKRHPFAFQCSYNLGVAEVALLKKCRKHGSFESTAKLMQERAEGSCTALKAACYQKESTKSDWSPSDTALLMLVTQLVEHFAAGGEIQEAMMMVDLIVIPPGWSIRNLRP